MKIGLFDILRKDKHVIALPNVLTVSRLLFLPVIAFYLQNKLSYQGMIQQLQKESEHFAKRQMTWFKKDKRIHWVKNYREAENLVEKFL